ncbi:MAG TPA: ubiquinol-cytochrome c reductase iron-sulfur subunit [Thiotrichaceae bacterium]|jgi:ubiquinol-cytochrome c reductase iron-sulfur subunit|nr:ubiquinol-cytochrome c reductase iron-sulfur subunit [Thiotrichaceae bacterium]HIM07191.1 ubiquinol-cytochrome c reductase iron-sulfur subunit [Gammaproteobacteria bacterium]
MENSNVDKSRRRFLTAAATVVGGAGTVAGAIPFIATMAPSAKTKAVGAPVEVDISNLQPGERLIKEWQGKPVWILRRTKEMLEDIASQDADVRDPASDASAQPDYAKNEYRAREDEYLIVLGVCTHLGCSPKFVLKDGDNRPSEDWKGGFFCPCHGSRFDLAGRVFKGVPAPTNLVVPPYKFLSPSLLLIGDDSEAV